MQGHEVALRSGRVMLGVWALGLVLAAGSAAVAQSTDPIGSAIGLKPPAKPVEQPAQQAQQNQQAQQASTPAPAPAPAPAVQQAAAPGVNETAEQLAERIRKQKELEGLELKPLPPVFPVVMPVQPALVAEPREAAQGAGTLQLASGQRVPGAGAFAEVSQGLPRVWAEVRDFTPGNIAAGDRGIFVSAHPFGASKVKAYRVQRFSASILELEPATGGPWSMELDDQGRGIGSIIGIKLEGDDLWLLDAGGATPSGASPPKLIQWNLQEKKLVRVIHIPPPVGNAKSFLQDLAIDSTRQMIYIADCGIGQGFDNATPAIVVVDLKTGVSRRVLEGHTSVQAEADARMVINGREVTSLRPDGSSVIPRVGVNPIVIDRENKWVYYGAMHGTSVYRVKAEDLADESLTAEQLARRVDRHGPKPVSDGMLIDEGGNIFITDVNASAIGVLTPKGEYRVLVQSDSLLSWPDGLAQRSRGESLLAVVNQLHLHAPLNAGKSEQKPPFYIVEVVDGETMMKLSMEAQGIKP
jgi:sugar lactone lactonase YvrE